MKEPVKIGDREFITKKDALVYYKTILNSYNMGEVLNSNDFEDVMALLNTHPRVIEKIGVGIEKVRISKVKYSGKSFELLRIDGSAEFFSYIKRINKPRTDFTRFSEACRMVIQDDLRNVKLEYFSRHSKKGMAKCQETNELVAFENLCVDHRQPNTFSSIVNRFIELKSLDLCKIDYLQIDGAPNELKDEVLKQEFRDYHRDKANLRIVKRELNLSRSSLARINRQKKDWVIKSK